MQLDNYVSTRVPETPEILRGKITMVASHALDDVDLFLFDLALKAVAAQIRKDGLTADDLTTVNVVFTRDGSFSMSEPSPNTYGLHFSLAVYALESLRQTGNLAFRLTAFIEELAHHYWRIEDETVIKHKVVEIASNVTDSITIEFLKEYGVNGL